MGAGEMGAGEKTRRRRRRLSFGARLTKIILYIFNGFFLFCGLVIIGTSIYILSNPDLEHFLDVVNHEENNDFILAAIITMIMVGILVIATAILGLIGTWKNSRCMLIMYCMLMGCIVLAQVGAGVMAVYFRVNLSQEVRHTMRIQAHQEVTADPHDDTITRIWYSIQYLLDCCGGKGPIDYQGSHFQNDTRDIVPETCCRLSNDDSMNPEPEDYSTCNAEAEIYISQNEGPATQLWQTGCYDALTDWLVAHAGMLIGIAGAVMLVEILGIAFACMLVEEIRRMKKGRR